MAENINVKTTIGFWFGMIIGLVVGMLGGGIALIGQGVWEHGRYIGEMTCKQGGDA